MARETIDELRKKGGIRTQFMPSPEEFEMLPPYIQESFLRIFDADNPPPNLEFIFHKKQADGKLVNIACRGETVIFYGGPKCRKTTMLACATSSIYSNDKMKTLDFQLDLTKDDYVLWFDTELGKSAYHRRQTILSKMSGFKGRNMDDYRSLGLKGMSCHEKIEAMTYHMGRIYKERPLGLIIIDQLGDLVIDINDRESVMYFIRMLEMWQDMYDALFILGIHVTRGTSYMTGALGHEMSKKMDSGFYLDKNEKTRRTTVSHLLAREQEVDDFIFGHNEEGFPVLYLDDDPKF